MKNLITMICTTMLLVILLAPTPMITRIADRFFMGKVSALLPPISRH